MKEYKYLEIKKLKKEIFVLKIRNCYYNRKVKENDAKLVILKERLFQLRLEGIGHIKRRRAIEISKKKW
jgi:hypothetical protein